MPIDWKMFRRDRAYSSEVLSYRNLFDMCLDHTGYNQAHKILSCTICWLYSTFLEGTIMQQSEQLFSPKTSFLHRQLEQHSLYQSHQRESFWLLLRELHHRQVLQRCCCEKCILAILLETGFELKLRHQIPVPCRGRNLYQRH